MKLEIPIENKFVPNLYKLDEDDTADTEDDSEEPDDSWED